MSRFVSSLTATTTLVAALAFVSRASAYECIFSAPTVPTEWVECFDPDTNADSFVRADLDDAGFVYRYTVNLIASEDPNIPSVSAELLDQYGFPTQQADGTGACPTAVDQSADGNQGQDEFCAFDSPPDVIRVVM
jgi:hypothetical protein